MNNLQQNGFCTQQELNSFKSYFSFNIEPYITPVSFSINEMIIFEGVEPDSLYYLFNGKAKLYLTKSNGKTALIRFIDAPSFIGEVELLGEEKEALSIKALAPCRCFAVPLGPLRETLLNDALFLRKISSYLLRITSKARDKNSINMIFPLKNRLANFILDTADNKNLYQVKHAEAAEYLGVSYRHLLFVLQEFVAEGLLKKQEGAYKITDRGRLLELEDQME